MTKKKNNTDGYQQNREIKSAKITSITSILVAFILGGFNIVAVQYSIQDSAKKQTIAFNNQKILSEKSFQQSVDMIKKEREKELFVRKIILEEKKSNELENSVHFLIVKISSIIKELNKSVQLLESRMAEKSSEYPRDKLLYLYSNDFFIEASLSMIKSNISNVDYSYFKQIPNESSTKCVSFFNNIEMSYLLGERMFNIVQPISKDVLDLYVDSTALPKQINEEYSRILGSNGALKLLIYKTIRSGYEAIQDLEMITSDKSLIISKENLDEINSKINTLDANIKYEKD